MALVGFDQILKLLEENKEKIFLITFHSIGDRDGVGSAIALSTYLKNSMIVTPDFITNNAKHMLEAVGYTKKIENVFPAKFDYALVLDTNNFESMGDFEEKLRHANNVIFIDHHLPKPGVSENAIVYSDESYNSTSSIVYDLLKKLGCSVDSQTSILLLNGIISDSADFQNATAETFTQIGELLKIAKITYSDILEYFHMRIPLNNRYALINDIFAANAEIVGRYILVYGLSSVHANVAADMAIKIGADAALFWSITDKEVALSARLRPSLDSKLALHLGAIMQQVGAIIGGNGGGHPCAAGAYGPNKNALPDAIGRVLGEIKSKFANGNRSDPSGF
ncbi:MAG: DHH family phosphoesterase [Candidatus Micrarchaeaceae archaeon]